jgi:hypothetical protein
MLRRLTLCALALAASPAIAAPEPFSSPPRVEDGRTLAFDVFKGSSKIGQQLIQFTRKGEELYVWSDIRLKGRVFFFPFTYTHTNKEVWRDGRLLRFEARTQVNDDVRTVSGRATANGFQFVDPSGKATIMGAAGFTTSWWNPDTPNQERMINTDHGRLDNFTRAQTVRVDATLAGRKIPAREYRLEGRTTVNLAYSGDGCLVGVSYKFPRDGARTTHRLVAQPSAFRAPDLLDDPLLKPCLQPAQATAAISAAPAGR